MVIYQLISPSGKCYIGQTVSNTEHRFRNHISQWKCNNCGAKLKNAFNKYNPEIINWQHITLHYASSIDELNIMERYYVWYFDSYNNGYNCTLGGAYHFKRKPRKVKIPKPKQPRKTRGKSNKPSPLKGKHRSPEFKANCKAAHAHRIGKPYVTRGRKLSPERVQLLYDMWDTISRKYSKACTDGSNICKTIHELAEIHNVWGYTIKKRIESDKLKYAHFQYINEQDS
jgi:hypothetical protein